MEPGQVQGKGVFHRAKVSLVVSSYVIFFSPTLPKGVTAMNDFEEITRIEGLPRVGQTVRSKDYGALWRVMEKREPNSLTFESFLADQAGADASGG
jgi:hypothetical protein